MRKYIKHYRQVGDLLKWIENTDMGSWCRLISKEKNTQGFMVSMYEFAEVDIRTVRYKAELNMLEEVVCLLKIIEFGLSGAKVKFFYLEEDKDEVGKVSVTILSPETYKRNFDSGFISVEDDKLIHSIMSCFIKGDIGIKEIDYKYYDTNKRYTLKQENISSSNFEIEKEGLDNKIFINGKEAFISRIEYSLLENKDKNEEKDIFIVINESKFYTEKESLALQEFFEESK